MHYIKKENDYFVKYEVELDEEKLLKLRQEIIDNCAEIVHHSYEATHCRVDPDDKLHIRNYTQKFKRKRIGRDYEPDEDIYLFEYDQYIDPKLVDLIYELLRGSTNVIEEISNPIITQEKNNSITKESKLEKEIKQILTKKVSSIDIDKLEELKEDLKKYQEHERLNANRTSELEYYPKVFEAIKLKEIGRIEVSSVEEVEEAYDRYKGLRKKIEPFFKNTNHTILNNKR